jgi:hypothetical protein
VPHTIRSAPGYWLPPECAGPPARRTPRPGGCSAHAGIARLGLGRGKDRLPGPSQLLEQQIRSRIGFWGDERRQFVDDMQEMQPPAMTAREPDGLA